MKLRVDIGILQHFLDAQKDVRKRVLHFPVCGENKSSYAVRYLLMGRVFKGIGHNWQDHLLCASAGELFFNEGADRKEKIVFGEDYIGKNSVREIIPPPVQLLFRKILNDSSANLDSALPAECLDSLVKPQSVGIYNDNIPFLKAIAEQALAYLRFSVGGIINVTPNSVGVVGYFVDNQALKGCFTVRRILFGNNVDLITAFLQCHSQVLNII